MPPARGRATTKRAARPTMRPSAPDASASGAGGRVRDVRPGARQNKGILRMKAARK
ncbi:hypothetical protein BURPS1106B_A3596 [Burkholderia pseudomallei 1106b]|nr:conserved hypothetical protein [Burkholderia pseudomallei MSHR346]EES23843.1 hypothetical protein BURPS1106B_A3596 [Burkholderia pseudomallei 1106b]